MNTYELTEDGLAIIITDTDGNKTLTKVADLPNLKQGVINSKALANQDFDSRIAEIDRQLLYVEEMQPAPIEPEEVIPPTEPLDTDL